MFLSITPPMLSQVHFPNILLEADPPFGEKILLHMIPRDQIVYLDLE